LNELRQLLKLAAPLAVAQAGLALMGLVDTAVVGRLGAAPLGATGLGNGLFFALAIIGLGAMMGLDPLFSQAFGASDQQRARELLRHVFRTRLLVSGRAWNRHEFGRGLNKPVWVDSARESLHYRFRD